MTTSGGLPTPATFDEATPLGGPSAMLFPVSHPSEVGEVRRAAESLAVRLGLGDAERGRLALIVTEAATNLARHARAGRVLLSRVEELGAAGIEVLVLDEGPGIGNVGRAMSDGYSTGGTAGQGLGAMQRLADHFDLYSRSAAGGGGTALVARVFAAGARRGVATRPALESGAVCVALAGERACGDSWLLVERQGRTLIALVDGLGHGPDAALASAAATRLVAARPDASLTVLIETMHGALRATRGAAVAIADVQPSRGKATFIGVGNVAAAIHSRAGPRSLASNNGTVGHVMRKVQEFTYEWPDDATLVMHTDGINTRWRLDAYPGLSRHDPTLLAGVLFRDAARGRDDATVIVARRTAPTSTERAT